MCIHEATAIVEFMVPRLIHPYHKLTVMEQGSHLLPDAHCKVRPKDAA